VRIDIAFGTIRTTSECRTPPFPGRGVVLPRTSAYRSALRDAIIAPSDAPVKRGVTWIIVPYLAGRAFASRAPRPTHSTTHQDTSLVCRQEFRCRTCVAEGQGEPDDWP
jgi:hypothetical protein